MNERVEFHAVRWLLLLPGLVLIGVGLRLATIAWPDVGAARSDTALPLLVVGLLMAVFGLWSLTLVRRGGLQVAVDRNGITDYRLDLGPIPWARVARVEQAAGGRGAEGLRLVLRHPEPEAGPGAAVIRGAGLKGGTAALQRAIARLAPQVPRDW
jgi:hypothetical protein